MFRDYSCILFADCTGEPLGEDFQRPNHDASLFVIQALFGWVSDSGAFLRALEGSATAGAAHERR
jgi:ureidoacrylate peracid hydrolase